MDKFKVVTLCGSTRFKEDFLKVQAELTLKGMIVISLGIFSSSEEKRLLSNEIKIMLADMHRQRIDISNSIYVVNPNGYIGKSTKLEIKYALEKGKTVEYLEPITNSDK